MKILLVGEYSRLHNSLKEGLIKHGNEVVILGFNYGFKAFPIDLKIEKKWNCGIKGKIKNGIYRVTGFDITSWLTYRQFSNISSLFRGYDVVQLINENAFHCTPYFEMKILRFLFKHNKRKFLLSCGDDYNNVKYYFAHPEIKSVIQPFLNGKIKDSDFLGVLKFRTRSFEQLHNFIYAHIDGVIATDIDYHIPLIGQPKYLGLIPNPVNTDNIEFAALDVSDKVNIFLGINNAAYFKKGCDYFEEALEILRNKYPGRIEILVTRNLPYNQYIKTYDSAHIILDQTFSHDQGYNALEAMAKGKVVFTGAEMEFVQYYKLSESVNINSRPDANLLVDSLSYLIENPNEINAISKRARAFIEKEHYYIKIAAQYLATWSK